jgi:hypothetical protein
MKRFGWLILIGLGYEPGAARAAALYDSPSITCEAMRQEPAKFFGTPLDSRTSFNLVEVEFDCAESLGNLPFLRRLSRLAEAARGEHSQRCDGTRIFAQRRERDFALLKAGFAPDLFLWEAEAGKGRTAPAHRANELDSNQLWYFAAWSEESFSNFRLHREFLAEFDRALPRLARHYQRKFHFSAAKSRAVARHGLMLFVQWAAGTFEEESLAERPWLAELSAIPESTVAQLRAGLEVPVAAGQEAVEEALKVALLHGKPRPHLALLADKLTTLERGDESAIFFALGNADNVKWLLDRGAAVDAANGFGKTPLFYAIEMGDRRLVTLLLDHRADVNHRYKKAAELAPDADSFGCGEYRFIRHPERTPLMHAAQHADVPMLKLLLARGARREDFDGAGWNAVDYATGSRRSANLRFLYGLGSRPLEEHP